VLRDGFDVEAINKGWSLDIEESYESTSNGDANGTSDYTEESSPKVPGGAVEAYEEKIRDPSLDALRAATAESDGLKPEVFSSDTQSFLGAQLAVLEKLRQGTEPSGMDSSRLIRGRGASLEGEESLADEARVNEHIGPVQFNMGGIQVDADDMLQRLKVYAPLPLLHVRFQMLMKAGSPKLPNPRAYVARHNRSRWRESTERSLGLFLRRSNQARQRGQRC
jgi:dynein light intermediate chain 1